MVGIEQFINLTFDGTFAKICRHIANKHISATDSNFLRGIVWLKRNCKTHVIDVVSNAILIQAAMRIHARWIPLAGDWLIECTGQIE